jgi:Glycosyltransferase family 87
VPGGIFPAARREVASVGSHPELPDGAELRITDRESAGLNAFLTQLHAAVERRLNCRYIQSICWLLLGFFLIVQTFSFVSNEKGRTAFGPYLGADFVVFYVAGSIFDAYSPERIYDVNLHTHLYRGLFPGVPPEAQLPYANAPFFVLPFAVLAQLPYQWAYLLWILISIGLYFGGLRLLWGSYPSIPRNAWLTVVLLAFSFTPFLIEGLSGGQVSVFGFFWLALALSLERRGHLLLSGAALSVCAYKPTLLVLILPMLVITRRWGLLRGFVIGSLGLALLSLFAVGWQGCRSYVDMLLLFLTTTTGAASGLRTWKYVDINSFSRLLAGELTYGRWAVVLVTAGVTLPLLVKGWWKANCERENVRSLIWAMTIVWTLVLNVYLGIYDTVLVVLSALIATDLLCHRGPDTHALLTPAYRYLLLALYLIPWVTQPVARLTGVQLDTLVLAAFGFYLICLLRRVVEAEATA